MKHLQRTTISASPDLPNLSKLTKDMKKGMILALPLALALAEGRATSSCYQAADEVMKGSTNVGSCVYFRTPVDGVTPKYRIGGHIFY